MDTKSRESLFGRIVHGICFVSFISGIVCLMFVQLKLSSLFIGVFILTLVAERLLTPGTGAWNDLRIATIADTVALLSVTLVFISILWGLYSWAGIFSSIAFAGVVVSFVKKPL